MSVLVWKLPRQDEIGVAVGKASTRVDPAAACRKKTTPETMPISPDRAITAP
jgi:hypothetical protein